MSQWGRARLLLLMATWTSLSAVNVLGADAPGDSIKPTSQPVRSSVVKIAAILPLSGDLAPLGLSARQGLELATARINQDGGVAGRPMQLVCIDTQSRSGQAGDLAQKAISAEQPDALIGGLEGSAALLVHPVAEKRKTLFLVLSGSYRFPPGGNHYTCRVSTSELQLADGLATFARDELHAAQAYVVSDVSADHPTLVADRFAEQFTRLGGQVAGIASVASGRDNVLAETAARAASVKHDALFASMAAESLISLAGQIRKKQPATPLLIVPPPWGVAPLLTGNGAAVRPAYAAVPFAADDPDARVRKFLADFAADDPKAAPDAIAATAYDSVLLLAEAARRHEKTGGEMRDRLAGIRDLPGVLGPMTFDDRGEIVRPVVICRLDEADPAGNANKLVFVRRVAISASGATAKPPASQPAGGAK